MNNKLKFQTGNAKLNTKIHTFSLPAGYTCPGAKDCLSKSNRETGKIIDGKHCQFRCFAASAEAQYPTVRKARWHNFDILKGRTEKPMIEAIQSSLPTNTEFVRIHVSGDFFTKTYLKSWAEVANNNPKTIFYAYTKAINFWNQLGSVPDNFRLTASYGGQYDSEIGNKVSAKVVFSEEEAEKLGLEIDHDDSLAIACNKPFALLLHGIQPKGSEAAQAWSTIKKTVGGYSKGKNRGK